jgi:peptidoglycan/LPS O-acetylase OafA/YrhL
VTAVEANAGTAAELPPQKPSAGSRRPSRTAQLDSLTGLRFIAAFTVFGFHVGVGGLVDQGRVGAIQDLIFGQGAAGVSFFFVLSGFVLAWSARASDTAPRFWRRRIAKIYPNHVVTWFIALAALLAAGTTVTLSAALPSLFLLQAWVPDPAVFFGVNTVSWSLSCEVFFYALFPLLYRWIIRIPGRWLWSAAAGALATIWLVPLLVQLLPSSYHYWAIWILPVARLPEFCAGMLLALVVLDGRWPWRRVWPAAVLTAFAYLTCRWLPEDIRIVAASAIPLALLVAAVGAADAAGRPSFLRSRWAVWLGQISFAFYLIHQLTLRLVGRAAGTNHGMLAEFGLALMALAIAVVASWLLYRYVELPGVRLLGRPRARHRALLADKASA